MARRDPRAAEAAKLQRLAAGERQAMASGGVVLGSGRAGMPTEAELLKLAAANMGDQQAEIDRLRDMGATMAGIVSALAELIVGSFPAFERREDGSFDLLIDTARMQQVRGYSVTYEQQEDGSVKLNFVPPAVPEPRPAGTLALVADDEDPPTG